MFRVKWDVGSERCTASHTWAEDLSSCEQCCHTVWGNRSSPVHRARGFNRNCGGTRGEEGGRGSLVGTAYRVLVVPSEQVP